MGLCLSLWNKLYKEPYVTDILDHHYEPPSAPIPISEDSINSPRPSVSYSNYESALSNSELSQSFRESLVQADRIISGS